MQLTRATSRWDIRYHLHILAILALMSSSIGGCTLHALPANLPTPSLRLYRYEDILGYLQSRGFPADELGLVCANASGTKVFAAGWGRERGGDSVWIISDDTAGLQTVKWPAIRSYLADNGEFVAWTNSFSEGVKFANGHTKQIKSGLLYFGFAVDPRGKYFALSDGVNRRIEVYRVASPEQPAAVFESDHRLQRIYSKADEVYLEVRGRGWQYEWWTLSDGSDGLVKKGQVDLPPEMVVAALDPCSNYLLLYEVLKWPDGGRRRLFNFVTGETVDLGHVDGILMFLPQDFLTPRLMQDK